MRRRTAQVDRDEMCKSPQYGAGSESGLGGFSVTGLQASVLALMK